MAIKKGLNPHFAEIGKIKIGGKGEERKKKDGKGTYRLPVRFEHFVITTTEKGPDGNFLIDHETMKELGKEPKEIPIRLPFDDIDMNFYTSFQYYHGKKCVCHGDGEHAIRITDEKENKINCDTSQCKFLRDEKCKVSGILSCHIPISMEIGGIYRFRTHSWNSVSSILAALEYFKKNTNGILQGLPLKLKFLKKATADHGNVNIVTIVIDGVEMLKMRELALGEYQNRMKLGIDMKLIENDAKEAGFKIDTDDPADIEAEYYTEDAPVIDNKDDVDPGVDSDGAADKLKDEDKKDSKDEDKQGELL
jgi:hypothetical protein